MDKNRQWTQEEARRLLAGAERKGQSLSALARELGVSRQRLAWWQKRLAGMDADTGAKFVEVTVAAGAPARPFAVQTRSGHSVTVWPGFDAEELARLLAVVEGER